MLGLAALKLAIFGRMRLEPRTQVQNAKASFTTSWALFDYYYITILLQLLYYYTTILTYSHTTILLYYYVTIEPHGCSKGGV